MQKKLCLLVMFCISFSLWANEFSLSEIASDSFICGWGTPKSNLNIDGSELSIGSKKYRNGIGVHAESVLSLKLDGKVKRFQAEVGVSGSVNSSKASVEFLVTADNGKVLWRSGVMKAGDCAKKVDVSLQGVEMVQLKVADGGDGIAFDHASWCNARFSYDGVKPRAVSYLDAFILTPKPAKTPRINGAKIFGVRPGSPFLFQVPVSGVRPMEYAAEDLPEGLKINSETGLITGKIKSLQKKSYHVKLTAKNRLGSASRNFKIVVGDNICLTPPMGWNSWYGCSEGVSAEQVKEVADAFVKSGLREHGWTYVNIDDCWQGKRDPKTKVMMGNERFPDMKEMCDYVHSLGLKIGIYSTPWVGTYAGFRGGSCDNPDGIYQDNLAAEKRLQPNQVYGRYPGLHKHKVDRVGKYWFFDRDIKALADWGFDFIKMDWKPNDVPTTKRIFDDLQKCSRDIVLSLSNTAPIKNAPGLSKYSNLWRTSGDIHDSWGAISRCFSLNWHEFQSPGHWNDMDMLQVGMRGIPNRYNSKPKRTHLTPDEQYTHMTMWCLQSNLLLLSCYVHLLDEFTLRLLTNDEVIEVNQDPLGMPVTRNSKKGDAEVWSKKLEDGSLAVGLFNRGKKELEVSVNWQELGIEGAQKVRDLWRQQDEGVFAEGYSAKVNSHGVKFILLTK